LKNSQLDLVSHIETRSGFCPKCYGQSHSVRYCDGESIWRVSPLELGLCGLNRGAEHLHYLCDCGFEWTTPTAEQERANR
jgi:hypothetical protein